MGQLSHTVRTASLGTGALFLISESGRGRGAQLLVSRPDYMGFAMQATTEWKRGHIWDILATFQPHNLGTGDKCPPPLFPSFVLEGTAVLYPPRPDRGDFKSHHLQARVTALPVPPHLCFQQYMTKKFFVCFRALFASSGGGGACPSGPPWVRHCRFLAMRLSLLQAI